MDAQLVDGGPVDGGPDPRGCFGRPGGMLREAAGFALAGLCAYVTDLGLFVWLRGPAGFGPLPAKALSFLAACTVAYAGNARGPYRGRPAAGGPLRRYGLFAAVNAAGAAVQLLCLGVTHYGLGYTSARADTVSGAGVGMALATLLRFWGTRTFVFGAASARAPAPACAPAGTAPGAPVQPVPPRPAD